MAIHGNARPPMAQLYGDSMPTTSRALAQLSQVGSMRRRNDKAV